MSRHINTLAVLSVAVLLLASCGSSGGIGDIFGGGSGSQQTTNEIRGTVDSVDLSSRSIYLTNTYNSMLSSGGSSGSSARVYFDDQTTVDYEGRAYRPEDLERGDEISVRTTQSGNKLVANQVTVLRNVSTGTTTGSSTNTSSVRGTVSSVDTSRRQIQIDRGYGSTTTVDYDPNTYVTFNGQNYRPEDLERGDQVDIRVRDLGNGRLVANDISVSRSVSGGTSNTNLSTIRGTVRNVDTSRRTIELEQATWSNSFKSNTGGTTVIVQYASNAGVEVAGVVQPITGLERGDVIDVQVQNANTSTPLAQRIVLVRDVNQRY